MNTAEILDKAADLIDERGWNQGSYVERGRLCASGAMYAAVGIEPEANLSPWNWRSYDEVRRQQQHYAYAAFESWVLAQHGRFGVHGWNDAEGRTKEEVVSTLRAAAQAARAES